ncbi:MAG TPA: hypothetical protein ENJ75_00915 [Candidatus Kaiserbacteria bacterium]|nr:hypothetical protein [Candidatus Kaiserbacteria bacterium]
MLYTKSLNFLHLMNLFPEFDPNRQSRFSIALLTSVPPTYAMRDFNVAYATHVNFRDSILSHKNVVSMELKTKRDLRNQDKLGIIFGMQRTPENITREQVHALRTSGVRIMSLYGDMYVASLDEEGGLSDAGKQLIVWMGEENMILNISPMNNESALDTLEFIQKENIGISIMANAGCFELNPIPQNISGEVIRKISALSGYIGIPTGEFALGMFQMCAHVTSAISASASNGNTEGIGIDAGCPFFDMTIYQARDMYEVARIKYFKKNLNTHESMILTEYANMLFNFFSYNRSKISKKMFGQNFRTFLERALPE